MDYLLFNKNSRWKKSGAKTEITLAWIQDWTESYKNMPNNIGLIPVESKGGPEELGIYWLKSWQKR